MIHGPRIVVYERQTRWAALLRRESITELSEARSVSQARSMLAAGQAMLLIIELQSARIDEQTKLMLDLASHSHEITILSVGEASLAGLAAEVGAVAHVANPLQYEQLTHVVRRYLKSIIEPLATNSRENVRTAWRDRIPWPRANSLAEKEAT